MWAGREPDVHECDVSFLFHRRLRLCGLIEPAPAEPALTSSGAGLAF
jgi:hypothetical protein